MPNLQKNKNILLPPTKVNAGFDVQKNPLDSPEMKKMLRLASFTETNPRPVVEIDLSGQVIYTNASTKAIFPDLQKKGAKHPYLSDLEEIIKLLKSDKESFSRELKVGERWFRHFFYYTQNLKSIVIYGLDITDQKASQERLEEGEKRYHMLFEKMNYGYALQDIIFDEHKKPIDYRFIDVNPAFEKLSGVKKEFIIGKTANAIAQKPETQENIKMRKQYDNVALTGEPMYLENYNEKTKKYFELYAYRPNKHQIALIFSDITNRKKTDEEKNNFISIMSHELRNPLTPIMANAQFVSSLLSKQKKAPDASKAGSAGLPVSDSVIKESIAIIEKQSKIMADLLNDILDVSRLSQHKIQLKKSRVNICDIIKNSIKTSMPFINTREQELSIFFGQEAIYAYVDPLRIEQIMVNVINNASKYTQPKGHIEVSAGLQDGKVEIRVKDNGVGMEPEKMKRIFELFSEESQPFMGIGGLGIGLNIVKNLVSMHKGTISVDSQGKDKGSEFTIRLPLHKNGTNTNVVPPLKNGIIQSEKKKSKVLVVDDNEDICDAISKILRQQGYEVKTAHNGTLAVNISKTFKPDTALVDIGLPGMNGHKVAKALRKQHQTVKMRLIAFSGYGQAKDKKLSKEAGFDHHLTKPVDISQLLQLIK